MADDVSSLRVADVREWLGLHIHELGRKYTSPEVLQRATGSGLQAQPYLDYLRAKYA